MDDEVRSVQAGPGLGLADVLLDDLAGETLPVGVDVGVSLRFEDVDGDEFVIRQTTSNALADEAGPSGNDDLHWCVHLSDGSRWERLDDVGDPCLR